MNTQELILAEEQKPLRDLPPDTCLVHSTNCLGTWGAGIAQEIKEIFPAAHIRYQEFCSSSPDLAGRCLIIPPQSSDVDFGAPPGVSVVCLFTSYGYGRQTAKKPGRDSKGRIVEQTKRALEDFRSQLERDDRDTSGDCPQGRGKGREMGEVRDDDDSRINKVIYSPKFNSGLFRVPWEETAGQIKGVFQGWDGRWIVLTL